MANEFIARKGFIALESSQITGSLFVSGTSFFTGSVDISGGIENTHFIDFSTTATPAYLEGRVNWIDDTKTLAIDTELNGFSIEVGHQNVIRVRNQTGTTISRGRVVYISGSSGNRPLIYTSSFEIDPTSAGTVGLVAADIGDNNNGYVISNGLIRDINTTAYTAGAVLYLSSSGQLSTTAPVAPLHAVRMGKVITSNVSGIIHVDVDNGYEIGELHDVVDNTTSTTYGSLLVKSGSVWKDGYQLTGSYGLTGSLNATSFTGSLFGTSSWATNAASASFASTASNISPAISNDSDTRITTANGNGTLNAESLLTFDGTKLSILYQSGDEGGEILLNKPVTNTSLTGSGITIDSYQNKIRFFEQGGAARGAYIDLTACTGGAGTNLLTGGGGVTINNNVDNYLITATGTANTLNGESRLTYDQSSLFVSGNIIIDEGFGTITLSDNISYFNSIEVNASSIFYDTVTVGSKLSAQAELDATLINVHNLDGLSPVTGDYGIGSRIAYNWGKTGGPALTAGRVVYLNTATQWADTQANATGSSIGVLGVINSTPSSASVILTGVVKVSSSLSSATIGRPVYLSPTVAGGVTATVPSSSGQIARVIGYVIAPSDNLVYFNPSPTWIVL